MAALKTIQKGSTTITAGNTSTTATITSIDTSKSFLQVSVSCDNNDKSQKNALCRAWISSATQLTFSRNGNEYNLTIRWQVVEFTSGVVVQRGAESNIQGTRNVTITAVTLAKSWVSQTQENYNSYGLQWIDSLSCDLTTTTNLALVNTNTSTYAQTVRWEVVQYDNCSVQKFSQTMSASGTSDSTTISAVTMAKTALLLTGRTDQGTGFFNDSKEWLSWLTSTTAINHERGFGDTSARYIIGYAVSFTDNVSVARYSKTISAGTATGTVTLALTDYTRTLAYHTHAALQRQWSYTGAATADTCGMAQINPTSNTSATLTRGTTEDENKFRFETLEWLADRANSLLCFCPSPTFTGEAW